MTNGFQKIHRIFSKPFASKKEQYSTLVADPDYVKRFPSVFRATCATKCRLYTY